MAKYSAVNSSITPTATADTTNLVDSTYLALIQGGTSTQRIRISEIYIGGMAASSAPTNWQLARDSTVATGTAGFTNGTNALTDASSTAPATAPVVGNTFATTKPQRSATLKLWMPAFNAYGGVVRLVPSPDEEISMVGNTASLGELSLSAFTGGTAGACAGHIVYEVV